MSYDDATLYTSPERFGLEIIGATDVDDGWGFQKFIIWATPTRDKLFWATDGGCSCPMPFERLTSIDGLTACTWDGLVEKALEWARDNGAYFPKATIQVQDMLHRVAEKLDVAPPPTPKPTFRDYVKANMFDGHEDETLTINTTDLLDELDVLFSDFTKGNE